MRSEIAEFESCFRAQALLDRATPLLYVLRRRVGLERCEADSRRTQYGGSKVEVTSDNAGSGNEIVTLLRFRKNERHIVALVTPRIHINRREENAESSVQDDAVFVNVMRDARAWSKIELIRIVQTFGKALLPTDKYERHAILERQIGICIANVDQRTHVFVSQSNLDRRVTRQLKSVLYKRIRVPLSQLHLRNTGLSLLHSGKTEQKTCERRARAIIRCCLRSETIGELVEAAVLKETPHGPDEIPITGAKLQAVPPDLPVKCITRLENRVPHLHGRCYERVAHA